MNEQATMIRDSGGSFWLQTVRENGHLQVSGLGRLTPKHSVQAWCELHGIGYCEVRPSTGQRGQVAAARSTR
jgi:hypothetical protein